MDNGVAYLISVKQCIYEYIDQSMQSRSKYRRLYPIAVRGMVQLGVDVFMTPKEVKLNLEANNTVKFPSDMLSFLGVGIFNEKGEFCALRNNPDISTVNSGSLQRVQNNSDSSTWNFSELYMNLFLNYNFIYPLDDFYGFHGGSQYLGGFKVDYTNNAILFSDDFPKNYCVVKYLAMPCDDNMCVPIQAREAMLAWIAWKDIELMPVTNRSIIAEKQIRRKEFYAQMTAAKVRMNEFNLSDAGDVYREGLRLVPKA